MNVFVLSTGRCGSQTFARACKHITNYTSSHEGEAAAKGRTPYRSLLYPENHIEIDNRLSWFLGILDQLYGREAYYVHLIRESDGFARSMMNRSTGSMLFAFASGILQYQHRAYGLGEDERYDLGLQYWETVNSNIRRFLQDKPHKISMHLSDMEETFPNFWSAIEAQGDMEAARAEWKKRHNARKSSSSSSWSIKDDPWFSGLIRLCHEIMAAVPEDQSILLIDDDQYRGNLVADNRTCIPFHEQDGVYWGPPEDDHAAIAELHRHLDQGVSYVVIARPAFWWLDHYGGFHRFLRSRFVCVKENEHVVIFKARSNEGREVL